MFSGTSYDSVGFNSASTNVKTTANVGLQTSDTTCNDKGIQSRILNDKNVQNELSNDFGQAKYDEIKLLSFLNRVTGPLLKELDKLERSKAFTTPKSRGEDDLLEEVKKLFVMMNHPLPGISETKISGLSWSSTGNVIAIGFESKSHESWCTHESVVNFFNISSYKFDGKKAAHSIKTDSCITCLSMHSREPSIVAVGTYSGNIEIWSIGKDNRTDGVCMSKEQFHEDRVTQISWVSDSTQQLVLASSSLDGTMCILKSFSSGNTQLMCKYVLDPGSSDVLRPGVTCFSFCPHHPGLFIAGLESGQLLLCSAIGISNPKSLENTPVLRPLHKKTSPIICVKFSPHEEHIFLVTSLDFKLTIHSIQQDAPLLDIYCDFNIIGAEWSPVDANILIAWSLSKLQVFETKTGDLITELKPEDDSLSRNIKFDKVLFNTKSTKLLALADADGNAYIWSIPTNFRR